MILKAPIGALALLAVPLVRADVTNVVDVAALASFGDGGSGETNGWFVSGVGCYAAKDEPPNFKFGKGEAVARSPDFGAEIVRIVLKVKSSSTTDRRLLFIPWNGAAYDADRALACDYSPTRNTYVEQTLDIPADLTPSRFAIGLAAGGSTAWGVSRLWVVTREPVFPPAGLAVVRTNAQSCTIVLTNSAHAVSNVVGLSRLDWSPAALETVFEADFEDLFAGGNARDYTAQIPILHPGLGGTFLYSPPNTNGILQISTGTARGVLSYDGLADYAGTFLRLNVKRYAEDHDRTSLHWTDGVTTNLLETLTLTDEFAWREIDLKDVPGGAKLLLNHDTVASDRRIWLDAFAICRRGAFVETPVGSFAVTASVDGHRISTGREGGLKLTPETHYRVYVREMAADGRLSTAATADVLTAKARGFLLLVR